MRILRLLALAIVLLIAYFAQFLFDHGTLAHVYPTWVTERIPALTLTTLWLPADLYTLGLWLLAGSALGFGALVPSWPRPLPPGASSPSDREAASSGRTAWPAIVLALLLVMVALSIGWGWTALPVRIDAALASFGLQAQALAGGTGTWLEPGVTGAPQLASAPVGLLAPLAGSALAASHLLGLLGAVLIVVATYLLAVELFAESPSRRQLGLLAAGFTGCTLVILHFGRLAPYLPAVAAGVWAAWLLLAGSRKQKRSWLVMSALLAGAACWFDRNGLVFVLLLLAWWPNLRPKRWAEFATWAGCTLGILSPLLLAWLANPQSFKLYLYGGQEQFVSGWWSNLLATAATFFWTADASTTFGISTHYVNSLIAPLFVLAFGSLLLCLDRRPGWHLITWLAITLLWSSATNALAPYWPTLLPILPLVGLAVTYALDRMAALWSEVSSEAAAEDESTTASSLALGLLVAVALLTWSSYYQFAANNGDPPSYTGRALSMLGPGTVALLVASTPEHAVRLDDPVVQFAAGERANQAIAVGVDALPATLPAGSTVIVQGADRMALAAARARYPQAIASVTRDLQANPRLFVLRLP